MNSIFLKKYFFRQGGFAALLATMVVMALILAVITSLSLITIIEQKISANTVHSAQAYYAAESGIEDSLYRLIKNKNYAASSTLVVGEGTATIAISDELSQKNILVSGQKNNRFRKLQIKLTAGSQGASFNYGAQVGSGGLFMDNNSLVQGSVYSNGSIQGSTNAEITGDAWVANNPLIADQQSLSNNTDFVLGQASPVIDAAQSFIPATSGNFIKISLLLKKSGSPTSKTVRVLNDNDNKPSKILAASGAYGILDTSQISSSSYAWTDVFLNSPTALQAGTKYWILIDAALDEDNYIFWGKDATNGYAGGMGQYSPNWNAVTPVWASANGDLAFKAWLGLANNFLNSVSVGANAHANTITNSTIAGDAYYQTITNTTVNGTSHPGSADPAIENLPITQAMIDSWKIQAEAGGTLTGDYILNGGSVDTLGPKKIVGNLTVSNGGDLTITGTLYVTGNINIYNNAHVRLSPDYGENSGILLSEGIVNVSNGCVFYGSGDNGFLLVASLLSGQAINLNNNSDTALFFAPNGTIEVSNNAILKELVANRLHLNNGAQIIYESGLASIIFSSGPSGSWEVTSWQEVP